MRIDGILRDEPWSPENSRPRIFFGSVLIGLLAGGFEGGIVAAAIPVGDAAFWDTLAFGAWMGVGAGIACGMALMASRNLGIRVSLAAGFGALLLPVSMILAADGRPLGHWEPDPLKAGRTLLDTPVGWAVYLGTAMACTLAVLSHATRCCLSRPRLILLVLISGAGFGFRSQAFFWEARGGVSAFPGGILCALTALSGTLILHRFRRLATPRTLGAAIAALSLFLIWAVKAMPFTAPSEIVDMTFTDDGGQVITVHKGNAIRLWDCREDAQGTAQPLKETGCWRFTKRRSWHAPMILRYPFAAALAHGVVQIWKIPEMRTVGWIRLPDDSWNEMAFSPDAEYLAVRRVQQARLFKLVRDSAVRRVCIVEQEPRDVVVRDFSATTAFAVSDGGECVLTSGARRNQIGRTVIAHGRLFQPRIVATLSDGTSILAANGGDCSYLWNSGRVGALMKFNPPMGAVEWSVVSSDNRLVALLGDEERWVIDVERAKLLFHDRPSCGVPTLVASSPDADWIAAVCNGKVLTWKWRPPELAR